MKCILIALSVLAISCNISGINQKRIDGNGTQKKETRTITGFNGVDVAGAFEVVLVQGSSYSIEIEADENLLQYVALQKKGDHLEISEKEGYILRSKSPMKLRVQMPVINAVTVAGSGTIKGETPITNLEKVAIIIAGSGNISLEVKSPKVEVEIGGSGKATLSGSTRILEIGIGGSGDCIAEDLLSEDCDVSIGGSGKARVYASVSLKGSIGGSGDIYYRGEPKKVSKSIGGSGSIEPVK